ncbi:hypothetical protein PVAND_014132 [Polypedilum vanderplanki]|uniref:MARVEL domain-containing protein n=1 Tax=Polypedilum vanderplanki TaxID=319348 RepID=A0A9J6CSP1_POLVA|nr:hypothetical protein PVAND_014132 [Polypedilum vanderplanki]
MAQPQQMLSVALDFLKTNYNFNTFQEPRGVMRVFQFVFSIWGFFAVRDFSFEVRMDCQDALYNRVHNIDYPFEFGEYVCRRRIGDQKTDNTTIFLSVDASTGAQFFALTAVLSLLYALFIIFVYCYLDEMYKSKPEFPMADFALTGILAFFWLIFSLALNSGASAMKSTFNVQNLAHSCYNCDPKVSSFTDLNIALMIGFLNFFLWASDLWFLYKETIWFQNRGVIYNQQMFSQQQQQYVGSNYDQQQQQYGQTSSYDQQQQYTQQPQQFGQQHYGQQQQGYDQYGQQFGQM